MKASFGVATACAVGFFSCAPAQAADQGAFRHVIKVQVSAGYGVDECLSGGRACGKSVADALCRADGDGAAEKFGAATAGGTDVEVACVR